MPDFIDKAISNYQALPPQKRLEIKAAYSAIGGFFVYLAYEGITSGWRKALGIFLAVAVFCAVCALAGGLGNLFSKVIGRKAGTIVSMIVVFGFIGFVLYVIGSNWGR